MADKPRDPSLPLTPDEKEELRKKLAEDLQLDPATATWEEIHQAIDDLR